VALLGWTESIAITGILTNPDGWRDAIKGIMRDRIYGYQQVVVYA